jgi:hypothetical protein
MVSVRDSDRIERLMEFAQRDRMDEEPTFSVFEGLAILHYHRHVGTAVLGFGDLREFHLLQQYKSDFPQDEAA